MDLVGAACCGAGAVVVMMGGNASSSLSALALAIGFYGVHRVVRTGLTKALIVSPAAMWGLANLWSFVPDRLAPDALAASSLLSQAPANLAAAVSLVALLAMVFAARPRLGVGLATAAMVALGIGLLLQLVPSTRLGAEPSSIALLVLGTEVGWRVVAAQLSALCMFLTGIGPLAVEPLPRRGGAIVGAAGAMLLSAGIAGHRLRIPNESMGAMVGIGLVWLVGSILSAIGLGAMARAGAKPAGWIGVGLVVLGIFGLIPALLLFERTEANAYGFVMATPFALLGIGIALLGWRGAPLELARKVLGGLFVAAFAGGSLAWLATYVVLARIVPAREPWSFARLTLEPMATYGLVLWAALLLYLASPPRAGAIHGASTGTPAPGAVPQGGPGRGFGSV